MGPTAVSGAQPAPLDAAAIRVPAVLAMAASRAEEVPPEGMAPPGALATARALEAPQEAQELEAPREARASDAPREAQELEAPREARALEAPREAQELEAPREAQAWAVPRVVALTAALQVWAVPRVVALTAALQAWAVRRVVALTAALQAWAVRRVVALTAALQAREAAGMLPPTNPWIAVTIPAAERTAVLATTQMSAGTQRPARVPARGPVVLFRRFSIAARMARTVGCVSKPWRVTRLSVPPARQLS